MALGISGDAFSNSAHFFIICSKNALVSSPSQHSDSSSSRLNCPNDDAASSCFAANSPYFKNVLAAANNVANTLKLPAIACKVIFPDLVNETITAVDTNAAKMV